MKRRDFKDKNVLITGAAQGLGKALCDRFAHCGARIAALDLQPEPLQVLAKDLRQRGHEVATATADVSQQDEVMTAVSALRQELGGLDVLINNAGITHLRNFHRGEAATIQRIMEVNFMGSVHCTAAALDDLVEREGMIITLSSVAGFAPLIGRTGYSASKHALHGFFNTLRLELRHTGVDVMLVCPSFIRTNIRQNSSIEPATDGRPSVGHGASPESVAKIILHAAHRRRRQITTGTLGHLSYWATRLMPKFYETMMLRRFRGETYDEE